MTFKSLASFTMLCTFIAFSFTTFISCDSKRPRKEFVTFEEMQDPTNDTLSDWSNVPAGLQSSFITIDVRAPKSVAPEIMVRKSEKVTGWKGEKVSAQLLLWTAQDVNQVELEFDDFTSESAIIPATAAQEIGRAHV